MDTKRQGVAKKKLIRRLAYLLILSAAVALAGWRINQLKPAAPAVEMSTVWADTVRRGPMVRDVRGPGTLIPEDILWIQAEFESQVSRILTQSGDNVSPDTVLLVLTNPQMEAEAVDYEWQTKQAEANYADLKVKLQSQTYDAQSLVAAAQSELKQTQLIKEKDEQLFQARLIPEIEAKLAQAKWEQTASRYQLQARSARHPAGPDTTCDPTETPGSTRRAPVISGSELPANSW